jgi:hypothetical protein
MIWSEFKTAVRVYLVAHNRRQGVQTLIDSLIQAGAIDLQQAIPYYQTGHSDIYQASDLSADGYASSGNLPAGKIERARIVKFDPDQALMLVGVYLGLDQVPWSEYLRMRGGEFEFCAGKIAIDPTRRRFAFVPGLNDASRLVIDWSGVKVDFDDADPVPFDEAFAQAVGEYVLAHLTRDLDKDPGSYEVLFRSFRRKKTLLHSAALEKLRIADMTPDSNLDGDESLTSDGSFTVESSNAGFLFRPSITSLTGAGVTTLEGSPQALLAAGTVYMLIIGGLVQYWRLVAGDAATDVNAGLVRPADFNGRMWSQIL